MFPIGPPELSTDAALARLHLETFSETPRGGRPGGPSYEVRERQWREAFDRQDGSWFCYVIENDDGELVGFAKGTPHDGGVPGYAGELNKIYLLQRVQRQKLVTSMLLFGDAANRRTVSTRRSAPTGFTVTQASLMAPMAGPICAHSLRAAVVDARGRHPDY